MIEKKITTKGAVLPVLAQNVQDAQALVMADIVHDQGALGALGLVGPCLVPGIGQGLHGDLKTPVHGLEDLAAGREVWEDQQNLQVRRRELQKLQTEILKFVNVTSYLYSNKYNLTLKWLCNIVSSW